MVDAWTRARVVLTCRGLERAEVSAVDLEKAGISQSTASQFMAVLQRAGLVGSTRIGQWTYYRRNEARIAALPELVGTSL